MNLSSKDLFTQALHDIAHEDTTNIILTPPMYRKYIVLNNKQGCLRDRVHKIFTYLWSRAII